MSFLWKKWFIVKANSISLGPFRNNILDKDIKAMFWPLNLLQLAVLLPKFRIKNDIIIPNDVLYKIVLVFGVSFYFCLNIYRYFHMFDKEVQDATIVVMQNYVSYADAFFFMTNFILILICNLKYSKNIVDFVLDIQDVHRFVNFCSSKNYVRSNWFCVILFLIMAIAFYVYCRAVMTFIPHYLTVTAVATFVFDVDKIFAIQLMRLLNEKVIQWNRRALVDCQNEMFDKNMFGLYQKILACYENYKKCFQASVSFFDILFILI